MLSTWLSSPAPTSGIFVILLVGTGILTGAITRLILSGLIVYATIKALRDDNPGDATEPPRICRLAVLQTLVSALRKTDGAVGAPSAHADQPVSVALNRLTSD